MIKKVYILAIFAIVASSCGRGKSEPAITVADTSLSYSLRREIHLRDSIMNDALFTISDISSTLATIKSKEGIVMNEVEFGKSEKDQIKEDLELLSNLLDKKKESFSALQCNLNSLKSENSKMDGLEKLINQLESEITERDKTINQLLANINNLEEQVALMNEDIKRITNDNEVLQEALVETTATLNSAYYIVGTEKELLEKEILIKTGTIFRSLEVNPDLDRSLLTAIDINNVDKIDIRGKKIDIIGNFPSSSYTLIAGADKKNTESIYIDDKKAFWKDSKILVISYK